MSGHSNFKLRHYRRQAHIDVFVEACQSQIVRIRVRRQIVRIDIRRQADRCLRRWRQRNGARNLKGNKDWPAPLSVDIATHARGEDFAHQAWLTRPYRPCVISRKQKRRKRDTLPRRRYRRSLALWIALSNPRSNEIAAPDREVFGPRPCATVERLRRRFDKDLPYGRQMVIPFRAGHLHSKFRRRCWSEPLEAPRDDLIRHPRKVPRT